MPSFYQRLIFALTALLVLQPWAAAAPPKLPAQPVVRRIVLSGPVDAELRERVERHLQRAVDGGANVLILDIACAGGDAAVAHDLAHVVIGLSDRAAPVMTIAFVTPEARDTASLIAFACDQIVLQSNARLGDWEPYLREHPHQQPEVAAWLKEVADRRGRPALLARGMVDHDVHIRAVRMGTALAFEDGDAEHAEDRVKPQSSADPLALLTLDADHAARYGIADKVDSQAGLYHWLDVDASKVATVQDSQIERVGALLRDYRTRLALIAVGLACLLLEIRYPRATVPGIVAACCFVLLFWAHSRLNQPATALALALFGVGVVLLAVEVSRRPGYYACGSGGALLLCISLGLLICGQYDAAGPVSGVEIGRAVGQVAAGVLMAVGLAWILARNLRRSPTGRRLLPSASGSQPLLPQVPATAALPTEEEDEEGAEGRWMGAIGATATPLEPTGVVRIGDAFVPAVAEDDGGLATGVGVQVVGYREGRVVVQVI